jgi:hypothetical protein
MVLANKMGEEIWGVEVFHTYDHYSQEKKPLISILIIKTKLRR